MIIVVGSLVDGDGGWVFSQSVDWRTVGHDRLIAGWLAGCQIDLMMDGWMDGRTDGRTDGPMDGWMKGGGGGGREGGREGGWMDGWIISFARSPLCSLLCLLPTLRNNVNCASCFINCSCKVTTYLQISKRHLHVLIYLKRKELGFMISTVLDRATECTNHNFLSLVDSRTLHYFSQVSV